MIVCIERNGGEEYITTAEFVCWKGRFLRIGFPAGDRDDIYIEPDDTVVVTVT